MVFSGLIHPKKILTNAKAKVGDNLVLTKALGTGIVATALKGGMASEEAVQKTVESYIGLAMKADRFENLRLRCFFIGEKMEDSKDYFDLHASSWDDRLRYN